LPRPRNVATPSDSTLLPIIVTNVARQMTYDEIEASARYYSSR